MKAAKYSDHYDYTDEFRKPLLSALRRSVLDLQQGLVETITAGQRIAYKKPGKPNFLEIKVQREAIVLHLANLEGLADPDGILLEIPDTHEWNQLSRRAKIETANDLTNLAVFVRAAWLRS